MENSTIVRDFTGTSQNIYPLGQCRSVTSLNGSADAFEKSSICPIFLRRKLSLRWDPSLTISVFHKLMTLCSPRESNLMESYLDIWEVMSMVHCALFVYLERRCLCIGDWKYAEAQSCWNYIRRRIPVGAS